MNTEVRVIGDDMYCNEYKRTEDYGKIIAVQRLNVRQY